MIKFRDGIYLKNKKIKKQKIPDVSSEKVEDQMVPHVYVESEGFREIMQTEDMKYECHLYYTMMWEDHEDSEKDEDIESDESDVE